MLLGWQRENAVMWWGGVTMQGGVREGRVGRRGWGKVSCGRRVGSRCTTLVGYASDTVSGYGITNCEYSDGRSWWQGGHHYCERGGGPFGVMSGSTKLGTDEWTFRESWGMRTVHSCGQKRHIGSGVAALGERSHATEWKWHTDDARWGRRFWIEVLTTTAFGYAATAQQRKVKYDNRVDRGTKNFLVIPLVKES